MTFLEAVNEVLERLRESTVLTVNSTSYSKLIGHFVNDAKRQVEDAWDWEVLGTQVPITTVAGTTTYTVTGSGVRQKSVTVNNTTSGRQNRLRNVPYKWIEDQQQLATSTNGAPTYFAWNGNDGTDSIVELWPRPDAAYTISFNMTVPQTKLTSDSTEILVPGELVVEGAFARALVERGEDGSLNSSEAYNLFKGNMSDRIALEAARDAGSDEWVAT